MQPHLPFIAQRRRIDLLAHALLVEDAAFLLIFHFDRLLTAGRRVADVVLQERCDINDFHPSSRSLKAKKRTFAPALSKNYICSKEIESKEGSQCFFATDNVRRSDDPTFFQKGEQKVSSANVHHHL